jgi:hypothetical protein
MTEQDLTGLSQEHQNECRATLQKFMDRHEISDWGVTIKAGETPKGDFSLRIEITPPAETGLQPWAFREIAIAEANFDLATEIDKVLEHGYQVRFAESKQPLPGKAVEV